MMLPASGIAERQSFCFREIRHTRCPVMSNKKRSPAAIARGMMMKKPRASATEFSPPRFKPARCAMSAL